MSAQSTIASSKKVTITLPSINILELIKRIRQRLLTLFSTVYNPVTHAVSHASEQATSRARRIRFPRMERFNFPSFDKKNLRIIVPVIFGVIVIGAIISVVRSLPNAKSSQETAGVSQVTSPDALATINLNKEFVFPLTDNLGKKVGEFEYVIESANLQKQIIVQGQRATAVNNRIFLILNLKITNNQKQMIQLNTRDFLRIVVASKPGEQLAPDIHNDPVEVQAISTKYTRVGIALDESDVRKTVSLKVGEIDGEKQNIDLNFDY